MANSNRLRFAEVTLLVLVWIVLIAAPVLFRNEDLTGWQDLMKPVKTLIPLFIIFLINRIILVPKLLFKKRSALFIISVIGLIAVFTIGSYYMIDSPKTRPAQHEMNDQRLPPPPPQGRAYNRPPPPENQPMRKGPMPAYINLLMFSFLLVGFDTGLRVSFRLSETERAKAKLEKENVGTQLAFLRNQVSPHFFMNTLNNIHSLIDLDSDEAKESIIRLSKLMRHLLYESEIEKISISKEIEFVKNYVDLMKLRYSDKVEIKLHLPRQLPDRLIPPLLFTSYLENAFKHGISSQNSSFIDISFTCTSNNLTFEIINSNPRLEKYEELSGIGIGNSRKRLDLLYGDKYLLEIEDRKDEHYVRLSIPL